MRWLADFVYLFAGLFFLPVAIYQAVVLGKNRRGWRQRFGFVPVFDPSPPQSGLERLRRPRIWIHAVSLGEINATPRLVETIQSRRPDVDFVFSCTTDTGFARAVQLYGVDRVFRFPLDFSPVVSRVLHRVRPTLIVLVELEVWYNLVHQAAQRGIPVVVVNGRLTERSFRRFRRLGSIVRGMFSKLAWVGAQDDSIANRFKELGTKPDRVAVTSSLKWDSADVTDEVEGASLLAAALGLDDNRRVWVCGSTGPGEEAMVLEAYRLLKDDIHSRPVKLVIVPRKPERFDEVARQIERAGFACVRRSRHADGARVEILADDAVILGDTMGELRKFYSLADVVFVGRSLVELGGSDPMEVAALGKPIVVGPHMKNFELPVEALQAKDAIRCVDSSVSLAREVQSLLGDRAISQGLGSRAREVVIENQGATDRTVDALLGILEVST